MAVHGGAFAIPSDEIDAHRKGCRRALEAGQRILADGGSSLDAVQAAVTVLEDDETFDAGRGSFLNEVGAVELDAGVMDGRDLRTGSVAAVQRIRNPVLLARQVLESPHAVLVGEGAQRFAITQGITPCRSEDLISDRERIRWEQRGDGSDPNWARALFGDTVGAVALDGAGDLAAATSTGGSPGKPQGRVGDSPFVGAGLYADNAAGAVSTTGHGELIIPLVWAKSAVDVMGAGSAAQEGADRAMLILERLGARAGLITLDVKGRVGVAWNTPRMAFALQGLDDYDCSDGPR
jgi:beta-aspartyl-peptidase (threonine type)